MSEDQKREAMVPSKRSSAWIETDFEDDVGDFKSTFNGCKAVEKELQIRKPVAPKKRKLVSEYFLPESKRKTPSPKKSPKKRKTWQDDVDGPPLILSTLSTTNKSMDFIPAFLLDDTLIQNEIKWKKILKKDLDLDYVNLFSSKMADEIFRLLENGIEYYSGDLTKLKVFGKWHQIPRKQVAFGDPGLSYTFSGTTIPATPWNPFLGAFRCLLERITGHRFNFVLINRYKDGKDHIGEHRDDEKDLEENCPIASMSFGQPRDFVFRHSLARLKSAREKNKSVAIPEPVTVVLQHGSLLMMNSPTNKLWYHSIPVRKNVLLPRINLTFRKMVIK